MYGTSIGYECRLGEAFVIDENTDPIMSINMTCKWDGSWEKTQPDLLTCKGELYAVKAEALEIV